MTTVLYDDFIASNGSSPNATTFVTSVVGTGSVVDIQSNQLRFLGGSTNPSDARAFCRDVTGTNFALGDFDIYMLIDPGATLHQQFFAPVARTTNDWSVAHPYMPVSGYACEIEPSTSTSNVNIYKHLSDTFSAITGGAGNFAFTGGTKTWLHFQGRKTALRARLWNQGSDPPAWLVDTTDSDLTSGGIQVRNLTAVSATIAVDTMWIDDGKSLIVPRRALMDSAIYRM